MPRDICAISEELATAYLTACAYDGIGNILQEHEIQARGRDNQVAIKVGRYVQSDPIGFNGGSNLFNYVGQNPIRYSDYLGLVDVNKMSMAWSYDNYTSWRANHSYNNSNYFTLGAHGKKNESSGLYDPYAVSTAEEGGSLLSFEEVGQDMLDAGYTPDKPIHSLVCGGSQGGINSFNGRLAYWLAKKFPGKSITMIGSPGDVTIRTKVGRFSGATLEAPLGWQSITASSKSISLPVPVTITPPPLN